MNDPTCFVNRACFITSNSLEDKQYGMKYGRIGARELGKSKEKACTYRGAEWMYKDNSQLRMEDFIFPYGKLDPENDWVKLAALVPWEIAEERYAARFVNNGHPAHPARMALGALLIQRRLKCSDQWLVKHIGENPYLQYFIGMKEYGPCPFGASTLVAFRKRFSEEDLAAILEASVPKAETGKQDDSDDGNDPPNSGTLILDATCCPADIAYPQDIDLLNQVREKAEKTVDELCKAAGQKKPRMYRKRARKDYLRLSKSKKRSGKAIRSAIRKQLQYIRRDIRYIAELVQKGAKLSSKQADRLNIMTTVYEQQRLMFESGTHSIPRRIVSLAQPWVRPIVRGKAHANTEFGSKLHISLVDGYARIERLDFEPFNESEDLWRAVARYRERYGCYPERILADKIYRSRQTLAFCKEHGIRLSGPALGKPPKAPGLSRQAKKLEYQDNCDRNAVEGVFGTVKTAYGLDRVMARLQETAVCVIGVALLLSNLSLSLRAALALFCLMLLLFVLPRLRSRAYISYGELFFSGSKDEFIDSFRIVKGGCEELSTDLGKKMLGIRNFSTGFEALVKTEDLKQFAHLNVEPATIDDIVVFTSKRGEQYE